MITINELRTGNLLWYDTAEGDILTTSIDWQDLKWLDEDPKGFNLVHTAITLTEEWLVKMGLKPEDGKFKTTNWSGLFFEYSSQWHLKRSTNNGIIDICYGFEHVHQLQNLYFALIGDELIINQ